MMRWFAVIPEKSFVHEMLPMQKVGKMDALLNDPTTCDIVGIPAYFDEDGRSWPIACDGCVIARTEEKKVSNLTTLEQKRDEHVVWTRFNFGRKAADEVELIYNQGIKARFTKPSEIKSDKSWMES